MSKEDMAERLERLEAREQTGRQLWRGVAALCVASLALGLPLLVSGLGNVPNELRAGEPVVASDLNANFQHVVDGVTAVETDVTALAARIAALESRSDDGATGFAALDVRLATLEGRFVGAGMPSVSPSTGAADVVISSTTFAAIPSLSTTVSSSGNPIYLQLLPGSNTFSRLQVDSTTTDTVLRLRVERATGEVVCESALEVIATTVVGGGVPPGAFACLDDDPPTGDVTYTVLAAVPSAPDQARVRDVRLMALELGYLTP